MFTKTTMYCSNLPRIMFNSSLNYASVQSRSFHIFHRSWGFGGKFQSGFLKFYSLFSKSMSEATLHLERNSHALTYESISFDNFSLLQYIKRNFQKFPQSLKEQSVHIVRVCTQQCECVLAHRIRRGQQMFSLYNKLWDEVALKELLRRMRQQFSKRGKEFLFGAVGLSAFNWEKERISDEELNGYLNEMQLIQELRAITMTCQECQKRMIIDVPLADIEYCSCSSDNKKCLHRHLNGWQPFLEREDLLVWRKECEDCQGMYVYKVYGTYHEVTAEDFLKVQIDTEFRMMWDNTAINLRVVEADSETESDIIYWEMAWPRLFSNRDYVFKRRYIIDEERNVIVIINRATEHPDVPVKAENHRVTDYWSIMVIKAHTNIQEPGMEFSLTYFDNPGVTLPSSIKAWVAMSGLPDYQVRLRQAAREYKNYDHKEMSRRLKDDFEPKFKIEPVSGREDRDTKSASNESSSDTPIEPSSEQPLSNQEHHTVNSSSSPQNYVKRFHAWQLFV